MGRRKRHPQGQRTESRGGPPAAQRRWLRWVWVLLVVLVTGAATALILRRAGTTVRGEADQNVLLITVDTLRFIQAGNLGK